MSRARFLSLSRLPGWSSRLALLILITLVAVILVPRSRADLGELSVDESKTVLSLLHSPAELRLPVRNHTNGPLAAQLELTIVNPKDKVLTSLARAETIPAGYSVLKTIIPFRIDSLTAIDRSNLVWSRLTYRITSNGTLLAEGVLSFSQVATDLFDLKVVSSSYAQEGDNYRVRVQALHPVTRKPVRDVNIATKIVLEDEDRDFVFEKFANTDALGFASFDFTLPQRFPVFSHKVDPAGGELFVVGRRGAVVREVSSSVLVNQLAMTIVTTDKPLYQPAQVVHARALVFSPSQKVLADHEVTFIVRDPEGLVVFQSKAKTSRFGIASFDWPIADNSRLGDYRVGVSFAGQEAEYLDSKQVRVSRYELPNFSVKVTPDRKYYLPSQNAEVKVSADYLFGQKVTKGRVKVVRESDREWNYREQKWNIDEEETYEGETDADGNFIAKVDLSEAHENLEENIYRKFDDIEFAAYFTDPTTNRTEQRRFALRATKESIHVYLQEIGYTEYYNSKLPYAFYVSASYPDGTPAQCKVNLILVNEDVNKDLKIKTQVTTNQYGLARVPQLRYPESWDSGSVEVELSATDRQGRTGTASDDFYLDTDPAVLVKTDKTLYRTGEPIVVNVRADIEEPWVFVDIGTSSNLINTTRLQLHNGAGTLTIPYKKEFKGQLWITAYPAFMENSSKLGSRSVLYPGPRNLQIEVKPTQASYRPGESARLEFGVKVGSNSSLESALGVVVVDSAVEERSRTDQEFGRNYSNSFQSLIGDDEQLAGVTLNQLRNLDMSKPVRADLALVAEILLNQGRSGPNFAEDEAFDDDQGRVFRSNVERALSPVRMALYSHYTRTSEYPRDRQSLNKILLVAGVDTEKVLDPWGRPFIYSFSTHRESDLLHIRSSGADKERATDDDFDVWNDGWPYFRPFKEAIDRAVSEYHRRTGGFIRDFETLNTELKKTDIDLQALRDRWGRPYRFTFETKLHEFVVVVASSGPNRVFDDGAQYWDDFVVSTSAIDYFAETGKKINGALTQYMRSNKTFPVNEQELIAATRDAGIDLSTLTDAWGMRTYFSFQQKSRYVDVASYEVRSRFSQSDSKEVKIEPTTQLNRVVNVRSSGPDRIPGTGDDFDLATFETTISAESVSGITVTPMALPLIYSGSGGVIVGNVVDMNGAAVPGATVLLDSERRTTTDENGSFEFSNVAPGNHQILVDANGFKKSIVNEVLASASGITKITVQLEAGQVTETVTVASEAPSLRRTIELNGVDVLPMSGRRMSRSKNVNVVTKSGSSQDSFTPRLREYFPETLLWQPELTTDKRGRAQLDFKLADNITTWKVSVIASTETGELGTAETEIRAFQPFFAELDPPRILTEGDRISLPVVLRNYLPKTQTVDLELKPESWFSVLDANQKRIQVPAGDARTPTFDLRANSAIANGKQRVTARATDFSDAIEKTVNVHPDGQQVSVTSSELFENSVTINAVLPNETIPNSARVEVKIYPNLLTHVWESVEGIMQRPYGCGEQSISASYPSLLVLKHLPADKQDSALAKKVRRYVEAGYQRLIGYQDEGGGFSYWGGSDPDQAVTAYAIRFLSDAATIVPVDHEVIENAAAWLIKRQQKDGGWKSSYYYGINDSRRDDLLTASIARALAASEIKFKDESRQKSVKASLSLALNYLARASARYDEPYLIANYALMAKSLGDSAAEKQAVSRLRSMSHSDPNGVYWELETNTPFYGWGRAGRLETTALVLQAIVGSSEASAEERVKNEELRKGGLLFLLRGQDRYGLWYSTQATVNVLDALLALMQKQSGSQSGSKTELFVNGRLAQTIEVPLDHNLVAPVTVDISSLVDRGRNEVQVRRAGGPAASFQIVSSYYIPWTQNVSSEIATKRASDVEVLRLQTRFDKTNLRVMEEVTCLVKAERVGSRGHGMLLAEIGMPPGAEVDRASLELAMQKSDEEIGRYEILPEKVVFYLWPRAGGIELSFKFKPRFAMTAKSEQSSIYDYYNPDANAVVAPTIFTVK